MKALPLPWFSGLAILLELVETSGVWPEGLLDAYIAMFPRRTVIRPPYVNGPSVCSLLCTGCGLPFDLDIFGSGLRGGYLNRYLVSVMVYLRWKPGSQLRWSGPAGGSIGGALRLILLLTWVVVISLKLSLMLGVGVVIGTLLCSYCIGL